MKKLSLLLVLIAFSCVKKVEQKTEGKTDSVATVQPQIVGNDADDHGCKPSAGYTWSALKNECVQLFNTGTRLNHTVSQGKGYETSAFVVFDNGNKAELFLDNGEKPFILERESAGKPWKNDDWELSNSEASGKDYLLKQKGKILYSSK